MRDRVARLVVITSVVCLVLLSVGCGGAAIATRAGVMPPIDVQIEISPFHVLLIHNGPTATCQRRLRDGCAFNEVQHEFYIHYIAPTGDRQIVWFRTEEP